MTDEAPSEQGAEEPIEDLEAPATAQSDVVGGAGCGKPSLECIGSTCVLTEADCIGKKTHVVIVYEG